jgi:glycosyltransferase involved in cell wall biosynthesis
MNNADAVTPGHMPNTLLTPTDARMSRIAAREAAFRRVCAERDALELALAEATRPGPFWFLATRYPFLARLSRALARRLMPLAARLLARLRARRLRRDPIVQIMRPFFDPAWYAASTRQVERPDTLLDWLDHGLRSGRAPNAFFDPAWYSCTYALRPGQNPVLHYAKKGAALRYDPSPAFSTGYYLDHYRDVGERGDNPLAHYLAHGRKEGRSPRPPGPDALPATVADIVEVILPRGGEVVAIFVAHSPDGALASHVLPYLAALSRAGIATTLVVATGHPFTAPSSLAALLDGLYIRENAGWDFAAWSHVLQLNPHFFNARTLFWLNDSVIGRLDEAALRTVLDRIRTSAADVVGLTGSRDRGDHIHNFFLAFKSAALGAPALTRFIADVKCLALKEDVINAYQITLAETLRAAGLKIEILFPNPPGDEDANRIVTDWQALIDEGFPFLKPAVAPSQPAWRPALTATGGDLATSEASMLKPMAAPTLLKQPLLAFIGPFNYANGLGVASRGYLRALAHTGLRASTSPIERPFHVHAHIAPALATTPPGRPDVALVHINPEAWGALLTPAQIALIGAARHRVGLFVWESNSLPAVFAERTRGLDAVWVPSEFCAAAFRPVSEAPVHVLPYVIPVRAAYRDTTLVTALRAELGLTPDTRTILFSFDASSFLERKNPHALVRAFGRSGLVGEGWALVLKTKHLAATSSLSTLAKDTPGCLLINRAASPGEAAALLDLADIYASPHASEGFGLTIAEAMSCGKPVVATDFGGTTDLLDASCGFPVAYSPWQLEDALGPYGAGTAWARIDEDALAHTLRRVAALPTKALAKIGAAAQARVVARLSAAAVGSRMRALIGDVISL